MGASFNNVGGQVANDRLLGDVFVVHRQVVARVIMSVNVVDLSTRQDTASIPRDSCGRPRLDRADVVGVVGHRAYQRVFRRQSQVGVQGSEVGLYQIGINELPRRTVRVNRSVNDFCLGTFQYFPSRLVSELRVKLFRHRGRLSVPIAGRVRQFLQGDEVEVCRVSMEQESASVV